ncbi:hypothetical protein GLYMA_01G000359v4 [Glycine max]|nr:hypothetical protein GLYMA_01G000359v4 [Glycine max]KAH1160874.1 hypothetical protein GYH30_000007 [Glycine max]
MHACLAILIPLRHCCAPTPPSRSSTYSLAPPCHRHPPGSCSYGFCCCCQWI